MNNNQTNGQVRRAAITGLAVVGFIALVAAGMWLAVYSTRFVPTVVNRTGSAVVYLGSVLIPSPKAGISVVSTTTAPTTISFGVTEASSSSTSSPHASATSTNTIHPHWTSGVPVALTNTANYYGLPDLAVTIENIGYDSNGALVSTTTIPTNTPIAVKFRVTNVGTNVSGSWTMNISLLSGSHSINQTFTQASLAPGQPSEYIVHFANTTPGANTISIVIDPNHQLTESDTNNNSISATVTML
jgi:hypothetical protein